MGDRRQRTQLIAASILGATVISIVPVGSAAADVRYRPPFSSYSEERCVPGRHLLHQVAQSSCSAVAVDRPTGAIGVDVVISAPDEIPVSGWGYASAGVVAAHDLVAPATSVTVSATIRINDAHVTRSNGLLGLPDEGVNGRAQLRLDVAHQDVPDCGGSHQAWILEYWDGVDSHPGEILTLSAAFEACGDHVPAGLLTLDVSGHAQSYLSSGVTGHLGATGSIGTHLDVDVLEIEIQIA